MAEQVCLLFPDHEDELFGLGRTPWIIILSVAAGVLLILFLLLIAQQCAMSRLRTSYFPSSPTAQRAHGSSDTDSNFEDYSKYQANGNSFIHAYDNGGYNSPRP